MPLPRPRAHEPKDEFIDRCMGDDTMVGDYDDTGQRRAICERQWDSRNKGGASMNAFEELKSEVRKALADMKAAMEQTLAEIKGVVTALDGKVSGFEAKLAETVGQVGEVREGLEKVYEPALEKMLDRVEDVEVLMGAPRAAGGGGDEEPPEPKKTAPVRKTTREVFGSAIIPPEWRGRRESTDR
jgi:hypothetical protein